MKTNNVRRVSLKSSTPEQPVVKKREGGYAAQIAPKSISITRQDISHWKRAQQSAMNADMPKRVLLHKMYRDIRLDAMLTSLIESRRLISTSAPFTLKSGDKIDEENTTLLKSLPWFTNFLGYIFDTQLDGTALVDMVTDKDGKLKPVLIPKTNVIPEKGLLLLDESSTTGIEFRNAKEYGSWLLEFGEPGELGMLNKAIPHVLFKRFAQSCWSELCEIYGIPPRVLKTNTNDPAMLSRAESAMRDMGTAAWFIIDDSEEFEFAKGIAISGDVFSSLINLCNNENSMLLHGAVIGQDTKNGNESKEKVSMEQLMRRAEADKRYIEAYINSVALPAFYLIGLLPDGLTFSFDPQEDTAELYTRTLGFLQYYEVPVDFIKDKFGITVTGIKQNAGGTGSNFQPDPKKK